MRYLSATRFHLWIDGIDLASIEAARHKHSREDVFEAGSVLSLRQMRFEIGQEKSLLARCRLLAKHFLHACHELFAAPR